MAPNLAFSARPRTPSLATPSLHRRPGRRPAEPVTTEVINRGSLADLERISGSPPPRRRIVAFRDSAGPLRNAADLARVLGISLALAQALWAAAGQQ
jgi:hypothetical protein